jgi:hypothetical protein
VALGDAPSLLETARLLRAGAAEVLWWRAPRAASCLAARLTR